MKKTLLTCCVLSLLATCASAKDDPKKKPDPEKVFASLDADHNKFLTLKEFTTKDALKALFPDAKSKQKKLAEELFARMDKDKSTHVTLEEFKDPAPKLKRDE